MISRALMQRQMFAGGGAVKQGYHRMPDGTIMPNSAMRYGGDVKKMQMGGEPMAAPSAAPADMSGIAGMLSQAEQSTAQETAQMGSDYAQGVMSGIDGAEDFKSMIDSIRGNDMPIQARYEELAGYVGPEDAQRTPESVLAMVQPTLMMTEEGAMGSGIGELMQGIAGSVEMETEGGQATPMGQGVGSMLMAGAQEPVQAFRHGGHVQKLAPGGEAVAAPVPQFSGLPTKSAVESTLPDLFKDRLAVYQQALGRDPEERKKEMQSNILFDIAQRGLAFASGVDPQTGENIANRPMGAQLARQIQTLPGTIGEQLMAERQRKEGIQLAALQSAEQAEQSAREQVGKERLEGYRSATQFAMQTKDLDFKKAEGVSNRQHETDLVDQRGRIQEAIQELQGAQAIDQIQARGTLQKDLARLDSELQVTRMGVQHEQNLEMLGAKTEDQIELMDNEYEKKSALQTTQLTASAEQNALDRALKVTMQDKDLGVKQAMQRAQFENSKELQTLDQKFKAIESDKDRDLRLEIQTRMDKQAQLDRDLRVAIQENDIEAQKALQTERLENAEALQNARFEFQSGENEEERKLRSDIIDRQIQQQVFDRIQKGEQFKTTAELERYSLRIKDQQAKYTQLGSSIDARMTSILIDPNLQTKYANGSATAAERQLYEQSALSLSSPKTEWDEVKQQYVTKPGTKLTPDVMRTLQANPEVFAMIQQNLGVSGKGETELLTDEQRAETFPVRTELGLPMPPAGMDIPPINPNALPKNNLDYSAAFGVSGAIDNVANTLFDFFGGSLPAEDTEDVRNYFGALNTKIIGLTDDMFEGRPSNFQIEITSKLLPDYGSVANGDETAVRQLLKLKEYIKQELAKKSDALDMGAMSAEQKASARREFQNISYLLAEMETVSRAMSAGTKEDRPAVESFIKSN